MLLTLCALFLGGGTAQAHDDPRAENIRGDVEYLASDECAGRRVGTAGAERARHYLAGRLTELDIAPLAAPGWEGYAQAFDVLEGIEPQGLPALRIGDAELAYGQDFSVAQFSGSGSVADAPLIFAGYGIRAPELGWDDYAGLEVQGAVVLAVRGEPQQGDPASRFSGAQPSIYADMRRKAATARDLGAVALVLLPNPLPDADGTVQEDQLPEQPPAYSSANFEVPVFFATRASVEPLIHSAAGCSLADLLRSIDTTNAPIALPIEQKASASVLVQKRVVQGYNLAGLIPGTDPALSAQYVVLGAHYDHLGLGGVESTARPQYGAIHHGADDNASGVACVLELARRLKAQPPKRSVILALFSAEEEGALGSAAFADSPPVPQESLAAMLNFDMVGRLAEGRLIVEGAGTAKELQGVLDSAPVQAAVAAEGLRIAAGQSGFGASDQLNFIRHKHPVLFFFSGVHNVYHKPSDTADKINYTGLASIASYAETVLRGLDQQPSLTFVETPAPAPGARTSLKVTLGTVPGYAETDISGMPVSDVRPGGPAALAGMLGGDVITSIGGVRVANIYDFMFALQGKQPGEVVEVVVVRGSEELRFQVTLAARNVQM